MSEAAIVGSEGDVVIVRQRGAGGDVARGEDLITRVIMSNIDGFSTTPVAEEIVRSVGYDADGQCVAGQGSEVRPDEVEEDTVTEELSEG